MKSDLNRDYRELEALIGYKTVMERLIARDPKEFNSAREFHHAVGGALTILICRAQREVMERRRTECIDCGQPTHPGKGSARCPSCWEDRCGYDEGSGGV